MLVARSVALPSGVSNVTEAPSPMIRPLTTATGARPRAIELTCNMSLVTIGGGAAGASEAGNPAADHATPTWR